MPFTFEKTSLPGVMIVTPRVFEDVRGPFWESFKQSEFHSAGITACFVQDNHSVSSKGVIRGLHYQKKPCAQGKLVRVTAGVIYDVAVDIRLGSPTLGQWFALELSSENRKMLYIPVGFAHGFAAQTEKAEINYKITAEYDKESEGGIIWNDPDIGIDWPIENPLLSDKDLLLPTLSASENNFFWSEAEE